MSLTWKNPSMSNTGSTDIATRASFQPYASLNVNHRVTQWGRYATTQAMVRPKATVRTAPRLSPESPAMAVASWPSICVSDPVECSSLSKNAASCLIMALNEASLTRRTYAISLLPKVCVWGGPFVQKRSQSSKRKRRRR